MTFQLAVCCSDGFVLAGDTKIRSSKAELSDSIYDPVASPINRSKTAFSRRHGVAIAMAGEGLIGTDPAIGLTSVLDSRYEVLPEDLAPILIDWGNEHFRVLFPRQNEQLPYYPCSMLIVRPLAKTNPLMLLRINHKSDVEYSHTSLVNGRDSCSAVFWLDYFRVGSKEISVRDATAIASLTVLYAGAVDPYNIGGLEVHDFSSGTWHHCDDQRTGQIQSRFKETGHKIRELSLLLAD